MGESTPTDSPNDPSPTWVARTLLREARQATLATQAGGQPFAGLVTPATTEDASVLLLLSDLSEHTRHLRSDPRCALLVAGQAPEPNPQTAPRITVLGEAFIDDSPSARARFLAVHPYAALYADFGDFHLWRIPPRAVAFVGGFARAFRLSADAFAPDPAAASALGAAAADILAHCNAEHAETMALLAGRTAATMVGLDTDGCDLATEAATRRVSWSRPVTSPDEVRRELIRMARAVRAAAATRDAVPGR